MTDQTTQERLREILSDFEFAIGLDDRHNDVKKDDATEQLLQLIETEKDLVAKNALIIAEYWIEEDGRPKHLIQDLWDVKDISVLDHIDQKYIEQQRTTLRGGKDV